MYPLLLTLLINELFTHPISLSFTVKFMGTFSITISIVIIDPIIIIEQYHYKLRFATSGQ